MLLGGLAIDRPAASTEGTPDIELRVAPATCVALHRGQTCYMEVVVDWPPLPPGRYCLGLASAERPLACWYGDERRRHALDYASATGVRVELVDREDGRVLGEARIGTAWVYRGSRRGASGWRLF